MSRLTLPLKWHGGKYYLAPKIVALMPPHLHYVEPFGGGLSVLLAHPGEGRSELVNDICPLLQNFWIAIQHPELFAEFQRRIECTPLSRWEWSDAMEFIAKNPTTPGHKVTINHAIAFFVACRQSLAGRMKSFTPPTRTRLRRGMNGNVSEWLGAVEGLPAVHGRLQRVMIENLDALDLIVREDTPETLFYCDPPYLSETRTAPDVYAHEMTEGQHRQFLNIVTANDLKGYVMISGYDSPLYAEWLSGWTRHTFDLPNNAAGGGEKRRMTEMLWCNF